MRVHPDAIRCHASVGVLGLGETFRLYRPTLTRWFDLGFVTDNDPAAASRAGDHRFRCVADLGRLDDPFVIVATTSWSYPHVDAQLTDLGVAHCAVGDVEGLNAANFPEVDLSLLAARGGCYRDHLGNIVELGRVDVVGPAFVRFGRRALGGAFGRLATGCHVRIGDGTQLATNAAIHLVGRNAKVTIGEANWIAELTTHIGPDASLAIGDRCTFESVRADADQGTITIGDDCMFSNDIQLMQTDSHPIFDLATGRRLNHARHLSIGDHVWVGRGVTLLGGARIGADSIVGTRAVTSQDFADRPHVAIAGSPARVVRDGVTWRKDELAAGYPIDSVADCLRY